MIKVYLERKITRDDLAPGNLEKHPELRELYSLYEEEGDFTYTRYIREELPPHVARKILKTRILELLDFLSKNKDIGVSELARSLGRSAPNVSRDLRFLARWKLVRLNEQGKKKTVEITARRIEILFAEK